MSNAKETQDFFGERVAEAYCYHLVKINGSLIYHHMFGDIEVDQHFIAGILNGWTEGKRNPEWWALCFFKLMSPYERKPADGVVFVGGVAPKLNRRGIRYMNAFLNQFGMMLMDVGVPDGNGRYRLPGVEETKAQQWVT